MVIVIVICLVVFFLFIFVKEMKKESVDEKNHKKYQISCEDGAVIEYDVQPPNFRRIHEPYDLFACGECKFQKYIGGGYSRPICEKYDVRYYGFGCLAETICDDFQTDIPETPFEDEE